jgi:hypothetical protein
MNWNHRIVDMSHENGGDPWFEIREVYYEEDGEVSGHTRICTGHETVEGLISCLERMLADVRTTKVVNGVTLDE